MIKQITICDPCIRKEIETEASRSVSLRFDGNEYQIDVCTDHDAVMGGALAPYVNNGRIIRPTGPGRYAGRTNASRERAKNIRAWAKLKKIPVNSRGRIPVGLENDYDRAHAHA